MTNLPTANWPTESGEYKVIQLEERIEGFAYLRFGQEPDNPDEFHLNILRRFGSESGYECVSDQKSRLPVLPITSPFVMVGAGLCKVYHDATRELVFYGQSDNYKLGIDQEHLRKIKSIISDWKIRHIP